MTPQTLHDAWLVVTAVTSVAIIGVAVFLFAMFRHSDKRAFFWALALLFISVSVEQLCAEYKNYRQQVPSVEDVQLLTVWLFGRIQEAVIATGVLAYLVFGRNGKHTNKETVHGSQES